MHIQEILKNPLVLAIVATLLTYYYLYWSAQEEHKKYPKAKIEQVGIMTPIIVGLIVFVIAYNLFGETEVAMPQVNDVAQEQCNKFINNRMKLTDGLDSVTYHLVGKNAIRLPQTDVFIDLAKF